MKNVEIKNNNSYKLDRTNEIDKFIKLIESENELKINHEIKSFNIALSGCWGSGKTTFINDVIDKLDKDKYETTIFNAWDYDYWDKPGESMIHHLNSTDNKKKFKNLSKAIFKDISICITQWEKISKFFNKTKEVIGKWKPEEQLDKIDSPKTGKKLIFIVEDLDRCKTSFVIKLLEVLKHILNVKDKILISLLNWDQLSNSIDLLYGITSEAIHKNEYYLDKIFDFKWDLPNLNKYEILSNKIKSRKYLQISSSWKVSDIEINIADDAQYFYDDDILSIREMNKNIATYNKVLIDRIDKYSFIYELESLIFELITQNKRISLKFLNNKFSKTLESSFSHERQYLLWHLFFYLYFHKYSYNYKDKNEKIHNFFEEAEKIYKLQHSIKSMVNFSNHTEEELYINQLGSEIIFKVKRTAIERAASERQDDMDYENLVNKYVNQEVDTLIKSQSDELKNIFIKIINEIIFG